MYELLHRIFSDHKGGEVFACFGIWHFLYMALIFGTILLVVFLLRNKTPKQKQRAVSISIHLAFGLYILDFFLMPLAYGAIDLEKLPFHMCTAMCVLCYLSCHYPFFERFKTQFALLGLISNLIYVIYPAGVGWYQIHPLSYRTVQTLLFHGTMSAYGIFFLVFEVRELRLKNCCKELLVILAMTAWALLGNTLYNGTTGDYNHFFNWFFVVRDPFYLLPEEISPYIMPFVMIAVFFLADLLVYCVYNGVRKRCTQN